MIRQKCFQMQNVPSFILCYFCSGEVPRQWQMQGMEQGWQHSKVDIMNHFTCEHVEALHFQSLHLFRSLLFPFQRNFYLEMFSSVTIQLFFSPTLYSAICLFIEDNWRCLLVSGIVCRSERAVKSTCAATTRSYYELTGVYFCVWQLKAKYCIIFALKRGFVSNSLPLSLLVQIPGEFLIIVIPVSLKPKKISTNWKS